MFVVAEVFEKAFGTQEELKLYMAKTMSPSHVEEENLNRINDTESYGPLFCRIILSHFER
jgi:hypothetical protein